MIKICANSEKLFVENFAQIFTIQQLLYIFQIIIKIWFVKQHGITKKTYQYDFVSSEVNSNTQNTLEFFF